MTPAGGPRARRAREARATLSSVETAPAPGPGPSDWRSAVAGHHPRRDYVVRRALAIADAVAILAAGAVAFATSSAVNGTREVLWFVPLLPVWVGLFRAYGLYESDVKRIRTTILDDAPALFH